MRLVAAIVLIALFGALNANKVVFQELAQINKHPFGATMLAAISTNLRAKTPISDVQDLLADILADLQADSATLDTNYHNSKDTLSAAIEGNNNLISTFEQPSPTSKTLLPLTKKKVDPELPTSSPLKNSSPPPKLTSLPLKLITIPNLLITLLTSKTSTTLLLPATSPLTDSVPTLKPQVPL
jgi:hypothetical protein